MNNSLARAANNPVAQIKSMASDPKIIARFNEVIGKKAPQFLASVVSAVRGNPQLAKADPSSVMAAAMIAATLDLDVNPSLGFSAIIPYNRNRKTQDGWESTTEAQFQIMTKGFVQLALRSGQYRNINVAEIYEDEYKGEDIITGEVDIEPVADGDRAHGHTSKIAGYVAYLEFLNGFRKMVYWSANKILNHAKKFSKSFDKKADKFYKNSAWDTSFEAMCRKTVLKNTLSNWGILSTQMKEAIIVDQGIMKSLESDEIEYPEEQDYQLAQAEPEPETEQRGTTKPEPAEIVSEDNRLSGKLPAEKQKPVRQPKPTVRKPKGESLKKQAHIETPEPEPEFSVENDQEFDEFWT